MFDWLTHVQASPLTYLAVLGACALDAVLPIVPSEAVVIAASVLAAKGELSIWLIALAAAAGGFLGDSGSYVLGRTAGAAAAGRLFRSSKARGRLSWADEALDRHGATIIVVAALSLGAGRRPPSPPEWCGCPGRGLPLPTRLVRPYGRRMRPGWDISAVRRSSGARCMPSCSVWAWRCWSRWSWRRRGGCMLGLAVGAHWEGGPGDEHGPCCVTRYEG